VSVGPVSVGPLIAAVGSSRKRSSLPSGSSRKRSSLRPWRPAIRLHLQGRQDLLSEERDVTSTHGDDDVARPGRGGDGRGDNGEVGQVAHAGRHVIGDAGAADCELATAKSATHGLAVDSPASLPEVTGIGGSEFTGDAAGTVTGTAPNTDATATKFWAGTSGAADPISSALSYIPEMAWNESGNVSGGSGLWASSGGASSVYTKPSWQVCVGVPANNVRYVPDISLTAAGHDGYLVVQGHTSTVSGLGAVGGTSASSPSFAGLMALVVQKTGQRWGNANTKFYTLASAQYSSGGTVMFHDITSGNNSVPGVTGFSCGTGYDAVTGVGTVDATSFVNNFAGAPTPNFTIAASPTSVTLVQGTAGPSTISTTVSGGFNNAVALSATGAPSGTTVAFSPTSIAAPGSGSSTMTITVGAATATGTYTITVTGTGGATSHTTSVSLTQGMGAIGERALGGWQLGVIARVASGIPIPLVLGQDIAGEGTTTVNPPQLLPGCTAQTLVDPNYRQNLSYISGFNKSTGPACLGFVPLTSANAPYCDTSSTRGGTTFTGTLCPNIRGNLGRDALIGPGLWSVDFSVFKNNRITERTNLQFRAEMFNILNHTNFQAPLDNNTLFTQTDGSLNGAGLIDSTTTTSRQIQFGLKLSF